MNTIIFSLDATLDESNCVIIQHYNSETFKTFAVVHVKALFEHVMLFFANDNIPFTNLLTNLSDSNNYMKGKKTGFETLLWNEALHLLNIDEDICYHTHNSVKKLTHFRIIFKRVLTDICTDMQWSPDICNFMEIKDKKSAGRVKHHWSH